MTDRNLRYPPKSRPRIKLVNGKWYAFPGRGPKFYRNWALFFAINFCQRLNAKRAKPKAKRSTHR